MEDDFAVIVPAGARHNVVNAGSEPLRLYTIYAPPEHRDGTVHRTRPRPTASTKGPLGRRHDQIGEGKHYRTDGRQIYQIDARTQTVVRVYPMNR